MAKEIGLGVIGCGVISGEHMPAIRAIPGVRVVAVCDQQEVRLNAHVEKYGTPHQYTDWRKAVGDTEIDAVIVCLPDGMHKPVTLEAARQGKHVLVEKPMGLNLAECDEMIAAADAAGVRLMVGQVLRRFRNQVEGKKWLQEGRIGKVTKLVRRRMLKNMLPKVEQRPWVTDPKMAADWLLYGFGAHEYDGILWLLDTEAETVTSEGQTAAPQWPGWNTIETRIGLRNGVAAEITMTLTAETRAWDTTLTGTDGTLVIDAKRLVLNGEETTLVVDDREAFKDQMTEFIQCIRTGAEPGPSGRNVRATMALLEAVKRSLEEKRTVRLDELGAGPA